MVSSFRVLCDVPISVSAGLDRGELDDDLTPTFDRLITQVSNEVESWAGTPSAARRGLLIVVLVEAQVE
jgi:hypothetical protein